MRITIAGAVLLLALAYLTISQHPRTISTKKAEELTISKNDDFDAALTDVDRCKKYVHDRFTDRVRKLLAGFCDAHQASYKHAKHIPAIERMYGIKKTLHKALLDIRYRMPQDAKMVRGLSEAVELIDYAMRRRIRDAEARAGKKVDYLPLGVFDYARYVRASNDIHTTDKIGVA